MISDWEIWACANELIRQHGRRAVAHAAQRAHDLGNEGDTAGAEAWLLILEHVVELTRSPTTGDQVN